MPRAFIYSAAYFTKTYLPAILLSCFAVGLMVSQGLPWGATALALACVCGYALRRAALQSERIERRLKEIEEELTRSRKLSTLDALSAGIAHEINNPLAVIAQEARWVSHLLGAQAPASPEAVVNSRESLCVIIGEVDRCKEIIRKLLNLARDMDPVFQLVDLNALTVQIAGIVEKEAVRKGVAILPRLQPDLPTVVTDPPLVRQVLLNLMGNALYAVGKEGKIIVSTRLAGEGEVEIIVEDNGAGISPENLKKVFSPFFSTKPLGRGTGLGLAICKAMVERLGGRISAESTPGQGAIFRVTLPIRSSGRKEESPQNVDATSSAHCR